jgi:hypothetical protein
MDGGGVALLEISVLPNCVRVGVSLVHGREPQVVANAGDYAVRAAIYLTII